MTFNNYDCKYYSYTDQFLEILMNLKNMCVNLLMASQLAYDMTWHGLQTKQHTHTKKIVLINGRVH